MRRHVDLDHRRIRGDGRVGHGLVHRRRESAQRERRQSTALGGFGQAAQKLQKQADIVDGGKLDAGNGDPRFVDAGQNQ